MGNDDIYHKDKFRRAESFRRKKANRDQYERVLIVCEGQKTEPNYFRRLRKHFGLNSANVVIADKKSGLDPKSLVEYALEEFNKEPDFDRVYCVFDRDKHATFKSALDKIHSTKLKNKTTIHAITSTPCFELWLLLHFEYSTRSYSTSDNDSNCTLVVSELKKHIKTYEKGAMDMFNATFEHLDTAIKHAKQLEIYHKTSGVNGPSSTNIYELVEYLESLKR